MAGRKPAVKNRNMTKREIIASMNNFNRREIINPYNIRLLDKFEVYLVSNLLRSESTVYNYRCDMMNWFEFVAKYQGNASVVDLSIGQIQRYFNTCGINDSMQRLTRRKSVLSSFYKFLMTKKIYREERSPIDRICLVSEKGGK